MKMGRYFSGATMVMPVRAGIVRTGSQPGLAAYFPPSSNLPSR
jgi:hypothetical protein